MNTTLDLNFPYILRVILKLRSQFLKKFLRAVLFFLFQLISSSRQGVPLTSPPHFPNLWTIFTFFFPLKAGLGIRSFARRSLAHLLILLKSNERLGAICSDRSRQMSDRERFAQITHQKLANE